MYINQRLTEHEILSTDKERLNEIGQVFVDTVFDKSENFNNVMRTFEKLQNHILSLQSLNGELVTPQVIDGMGELLRLLPTRDFEFSFLADYFMVLAQTLHSHRHYKEDTNLVRIVQRLTEGLKFHLVPFLIEQGIQPYDLLIKA
jgi:hypothetical protein